MLLEYQVGDHPDSQPPGHFQVTPDEAVAKYYLGF